MDFYMPFIERKLFPNCTRFDYESLELQTFSIFFVLSNLFEKYLKVPSLKENKVFKNGKNENGFYCLARFIGK
jgi:hypothetical protein